MYLINSTIFVEDGEDNVVGEVHQRWHLWKRNYDLYLNRNQFASIEGNFLAWEFVLRDESGGGCRGRECTVSQGMMPVCRKISVICVVFYAEKDDVNHATKSWKCLALHACRCACSH